jgi:hypothetical protein
MNLRTKLTMTRQQQGASLEVEGERGAKVIKKF